MHDVYCARHVSASPVNFVESGTVALRADFTAPARAPMPRPFVAARALVPPAVAFDAAERTTVARAVAARDVAADTTGDDAERAVVTLRIASVRVGRAIASVRVGRVAADTSQTNNTPKKTPNAPRI